MLVDIGGMAASGGVNHPLWVEAVAERLRFGRLTHRFGLPAGAAPYLYVTALFALDVPLLSTLTPVLNPGSPVPYTSNPFGLSMLLVGLLFAVWAARRLRTGLERTAAELPDPDELPQRYPQSLARPLVWLVEFGWTEPPKESRQPHVSRRLKVGLLFVAWALYLAHLARNPTSPEKLYAVSGPLIASVKVWGIIPFGYIPLAVDLVAGYIGVVGLVPLEVKRRGLIDFSDPLGYGGLKPVGDRIMSATVYYFLALSAYSAWITSGDVLGAPFAVEVQTVITGFIVGGSVLGVVLYVLPLISLHGFIVAAKQAKTLAIARQVEAHGPPEDTEMFPETGLSDSAVTGIQYTQLFNNLSRVENTREYPIDITQVQQIVIAAVIPSVVRVATTALFEVL